MSGDWEKKKQGVLRIAEEKSKKPIVDCSCRNAFSLPVIPPPPQARTRRQKKRPAALAPRHGCSAQRAGAFAAPVGER